MYVFRDDSLVSGDHWYVFLWGWLFLPSWHFLAACSSLCVKLRSSGLPPVHFCISTTATLVQVIYGQSFW